MSARRRRRVRTSPITWNTLTGAYRVRMGVRTYA